MLTQSLGVLISDFMCNLESSDWKLITMDTLNSIENGLQQRRKRKLTMYLVTLGGYHGVSMALSCRHNNHEQSQRKDVRHAT